MIKTFFLIIALFSFNFLFSQKENQDTIVINSKNIFCRIDTIYKIRNVIIKRIKINKINNKPLNGLVKTITGHDTYFITKYVEGIDTSWHNSLKSISFKDELL